MFTYFVYIIRSQSAPEHYYVGVTQNLHRRMRQHNAKNSSHTDKYKPWVLEVYIAFNNEEKAIRLEQYLKSGSGRMFCIRHF